MATFLSYVLNDGTEVNTFCEAERSGKPYIKRYREFKYYEGVSYPSGITPSFIEDKKR